MPTVSELHVDTLLSNVAERFPAQAFIIPQIFAPCPVRKLSDKVARVDTQREMLKVVDDVVKPTGKAVEVDFSVTNATYSCEQHAEVFPISDDARQNQDLPILDNQQAVAFLVQKMMVNVEYKGKATLDAAILAASAYETLEAATQLDNEDVNPLTTIDRVMTRVEGRIGVKPNFVAMDRRNFRKLRRNPYILENIKYGGTGTTPAMVTPQALAELLDVDEVIINNALVNTSLTATPTLERIWGRDLYIGYRPKVPTFMGMTLGYMFMYMFQDEISQAPNPIPVQEGGPNGSWIVRMWPDLPRKCDMCELRAAYDVKLINTDAIYKLASAFSALAADEQ